MSRASIDIIALHLLILGNLIGCKKSQEVVTQSITPELNHKRPEIDSGGFYASSQEEVSSKEDYFRRLYKQSYELNFKNLPKSGEVISEKVPYVGGWYPQKSGGTAILNSATSPLQKYDRAFYSGRSTAVKWETENHTIRSSDPNASWAGHCNGYSAAAVRHKEPQKAVTRNGVTFTPMDIKALLAEIYMGAKYFFIGGSRCGKPQGSLLPAANARGNSEVLDSCDDVNAGTFHLAITNWIGILKRPLIMDISTNEQVWNYPHFKFASNVKELSLAEATHVLEGSPKGQYRFNPKAMTFQYVTTSVTSSVALANETMTASLPVVQRSRVNTYSYILELDASQNIIGGEWTGQSIQSHPDFVWIPFEPMPGDGSKHGANPHVKPDDVIKLWAESVGQNPDRPELDVFEPKGGEVWGQLPEFKVTIDGVSSGIVQSGHEHSFEVTKRPLAEGDYQVVLTLGGTSFERRAFDDSDVLSYRAKIGEGSFGTQVLKISFFEGDKLFKEASLLIFVF